MSRGSTADRALVAVMVNANKLNNARFRNLGTRTLTIIGAKARKVDPQFAGSGQALAARAVKELNRRKKEKKDKK